MEPSQVADPWTWWLQDAEMRELVEGGVSSSSHSLPVLPNMLSTVDSNEDHGLAADFDVIQCRFCRRPFSGAGELRMSRLEQHERACSKRRCPHCCTYFKTALQAKGHTRICMDNAVFRCQFCTMRCQGGHKKAEHEATCELNPGLSCEHCGRFFGHATLRNKHVPQCSMHPHRTCTYCKRKCSNRSETIAHEVFCAANPSTQAQQQECVACGEESQCLVFPCKTHFYCGACVRKMVQIGLRDRTLLPLHCCKTSVALGDDVDLHVSQMLPETARMRYQETMMLHAAASVMYCPRRTCGVLIVLDSMMSSKASEATKHGVFADLDPEEETFGARGCPKCQQELCFQCRSEWHPGMNCQQYQFTKSRYADEFMKFCRNMKWMRCFDCGHVIEKKAGCNHITCLCGSQLCYLCGSKWGSCKCQVIDEGHLLRHQRVPAAGDTHECRYCHQRLPSAAELRVHLVVCQAALAARGGMFSCGNCGARFTDAHEYRTHRRACFRGRTEAALPDYDASRFGTF